MLGIAAASVFGNFDKAKRLGFANSRRNAVPINPVFFEMFERDRQLTVIVAAVVR